MSKAITLSLCFLFIHIIQTYACDTTKIIAHRGVSSLAPQNTLPAFQLGIDLNVDYIELDVQQSSDDSLIVMHDATVDATTSYSGLVSSYSYNDLKLMDAGSWFSNDYMGTEIPTLYEVLALAQGKIKVCVELKASNIESQAMQLIEDMGMLNDVVIFSFSLSQLQIVKNINSNVKVCYLSSVMTSGDITDALSINAEYLGVGLDPSIANISAAQAAGIKVWNYTVNDGRSMLNKMSKGLDGIITDNAQDMIGLKSYMRNGGLIAHWSFDENSGFNTSDLALNGNILNTANATWTSGASQSALYFNGTSSYVNVPTSPSLDIDLDAVSISVWVRLEELPSQMSDNYGPIYDSDEDYYVLYLDKANQELRFKVKDGQGLLSRPGIPQSALTLNQWVHITGVYNGKEAMIYLNGELMDSHTTVGIGTLGSNQDAEIGRDNGNYFKGSVDELRIYERPLSRQEVVDHYEMNFSTCDFTENFDYALSDYSPSIHDDVIACPPFNVTASYDLPRNVYTFDGMDYVNIETVVNDLQYDSHSFFTWVKTWNPSGDERIYSINERYGGNRFLFGVLNGKANIYVPGLYLSGSTFINDNEWHYIGYTWNVVSNTLSIYVDGVVEDSFIQDLTIESTDRASLGHEFDDFQCTNFFNGKLSDISIWKTTLSNAEVNANMVSTIDVANASDLVALYTLPAQCAYNLEDASTEQNHGVMCKSLTSNLEYIAGFNSTDYSESWSDQNGNNLSSGPVLNSTFNNSTTVYYEALNGSVSILDTFQVDAHPLPEVFLGNDTLFCAGSNLILDAGIQSGYLWNDNSTQQTYSPDLSSVGIFDFSVSVTNQFGCSSSDGINIEVEGCLSIIGLEDNELVFYPNPFKDVVYSNVNLEEYDIEIYDALGRRMSNFEVKGNSILFENESGLFYALLKTDKSSYLIKLSKN
jgi:glycerophosphoryl diester phosphodiesterase